MKISDGLYLAGSGASGVCTSDEFDCNCYLVDCGGSFALIDTGAGIRPGLMVENMRADGILPGNIRDIFLTHCHADHSGGAAFFKREFNCSVTAPKEEGAMLESGDEGSLGLKIARDAGYYPKNYVLNPCSVDRTVKPGDSIAAGELIFDVYEAAGHSPGGVCYVCSLKAGRTIFCGDLISFGGHISLQNIPGADVHAYARSVSLLDGLDARLFMPGHGIFTVNGGQRHIDAAIDGFRKLYVPV
jgi:glyoxylase-like metal-dependent hydrolase (beta-lactamase superfamily II)